MGFIGPFHIHNAFPEPEQLELNSAERGCMGKR